MAYRAHDEEEECEVTPLTGLSLPKEDPKKRTGEKTSRARMIVRSVLRFTPGKGHFVPCTDAGDQERMRVCLMTERKRLEFEDPDIMSKVRISKQMLSTDMGEIYAVKVWRAGEVTEELITFDGEGNLTVEKLIPEADPLVMEILEEAIGSGLSLEEASRTNEEGIYIYFRATAPYRVAVAIENMKRKLEEQGKNVSVTAVKKKVKVLPIEEIPPPREEIAERIAVDYDDGYTFDEIEERLRDRFPLEADLAMKWVRSVGETYFKNAVEE